MEHEKILTVPQTVDALYKEYAAIPVPYFIAKSSKSLKRRIHKGKGSISAIKEELKKIRTDGSNDYETLKKHNIGIDCSGFITYLYDAYTKENMQKHVWDFYKKRIINPIDYLLFAIQPVVSKMNANTLTSDENTIKITKVKDAKPMDLVRMSGGKHVVILYKLHYKDDILCKVEYIHSTEGVGVTNGFIIITDPEKSITAQDWVPSDNKAKYDPGYLIRYKVNANGIRRPKFLN